MNSDVVRLPVDYEPGSFYIAMVGLGTFNGSQQPFKNYYLMIDIGSDQTWIQCEGFTKVFHQDMPLYHWRSSSTYRHVPCNTHPLCKGDKCNADGQCTYKVRYASGSVTSGIVAEEKFTLGYNTGDLERILGLGPGEWSFLNQLGAAGEGKFSYCLEMFNDRIRGSDIYLRFGADATIGGVFQTTPTVVPLFRTKLHYYLNLEDISVANKRVRFPKGTFEVKSRKEGGIIIDSGAPFSTMYKDHFDRVADLVKSHFRELRVEYISTYNSFDACFRLPGRFDITHYPSITLHFQQANYVISDYKANFVIIFAKTIYLGFFRMDKNKPAFILGAMQQGNKHILYNVMDQSLSFATEYCELDGEEHGLFVGGIGSDAVCHDNVLRSGHVGCLCSLCSKVHHLSFIAASVNLSSANPKSVRLMTQRLLAGYSNCYSTNSERE
ncbi:aspartic proteinase nepenthesin-2-like [Papaver somniferum]|uniref:aspartic proteinase nepenthesin-2-like n=1 Tax=Papaver somniferum TaxID=3469 RepID=UPI000E6F96D0|nr:aspartic proteinase nepenthesin-2-like [Papaver somniferum]